MNRSGLKVGVIEFISGTELGKWAWRYFSNSYKRNLMSITPQAVAKRPLSSTSTV